MEDSRTNSVEVYDSYKFSNGMIIAFLKSAEGKLPPATLLEDEEGRLWSIKQYLRSTNSIEGYERIEREEEQNIFQYHLVGLNQEDKPKQNSHLNLKSEHLK